MKLLRHVRADRAICSYIKSNYICAIVLIIKELWRKIFMERFIS